MADPYDTPEKGEEVTGSDCSHERHCTQITSLPESTAPSAATEPTPTRTKYSPLPLLRPDTTSDPKSSGRYADAGDSRRTRYSARALSRWSKANEGL
jgi:hypothetical protein